MKVEESDECVVPVCANQPGELGWGTNAAAEFDASSYMADPSKAHLYLDAAILDAPRSRRNVPTPEAFKLQRKTL